MTNTFSICNQSLPFVSSKGIKFMGDFFKPWRRKIGVVLLLLLACLFAGGWVRSFSVKDSFNVPVGSRSLIKLVSDPGRLKVIKINVGPEHEAPFPVGFWTTQRNGDSTLLFESIHHEWHASSGAAVFSIDQGATNHVSFKSVQSPYWSLVIPLTLLSAYLLLAKIRVTKPKTIVEDRITK